MSSLDNLWQCLNTPSDTAIVIRMRSRVKSTKAGVLVLISLVAVLTSAGCAYSMGLGDRRLPEGYTLISIPVFKNATQEVGVEVPFTNAMIREMERSQIARVVDKSAAQVVLEGVIEQISYVVVNQTACTTAPCAIPIPERTVLNTEYRIVASTVLQLKRVSDSRILWSEKFETQKSYLAPKIGLEGLNSANALYNHSARQENLNAMAGDLMAEAHSRLTENF